MFFVQKEAETETVNPLPYGVKLGTVSPLPTKEENEEASETVTIAGKCCESGDLIQENTALQPAQAGDILAVCCTGAYNYSMSSNYNRIPRPAAIMIRDGKARLIIRRETYEDLLRCDK